MRRIKIFFGILVLSLFTLVAYANDEIPISLDEERVRAELDLLFPEMGPAYELIDITNTVNNIAAVFVNPYYRDCPNVVFFKYDHDAKDYKRVFEGLCIGIQDDLSDKTDLHTLGLAIDVLIQNLDTYELKNASVQEVMEIGNNHGFIVIPYQNFLHLHPANVEYFTIDKTGYHDFAVKLIGSAYEEFYPKDTCVMFDTPNLVKTHFDYVDGQYVVMGQTDNNQLWIVIFDGVDNENRYLFNNTIVVGSAKEAIEE